MSNAIQGIHHVTAISGHPQQCLDFYAGFLGLRLVKLTVNFDDPGTYHLYFGDEAGSPGTILTFFPWPDTYPGRRGTGQVSAVAFSVLPEALDFWAEHLRRHGVGYMGPEDRFGDPVLRFVDPDGLQLELVGDPGAGEGRPWWGGSIPEAAAIRGFHSVTLLEDGFERTDELLRFPLGFHPHGTEGNRYRYRAGDSRIGALVDLLVTPNTISGSVGVGTVHHVAWRVPDDEAQRQRRRDLAGRGLNVTPVIDRRYFHSLYFREPGGILFEIATDPPGFTLDEPLEELGGRLQLPTWLESRRPALEQALPPLRLPRPNLVKEDV